MKMEEIRKIKISYDEAEINELLAKGYVIMKVLSSKTTKDNGENILPIFILGLAKEN